MKVRDLIRRLTDIGGRAVRITGSHQQWELPQGLRATIVVNHKNDDVSPVVLSSVRRVFKQLGYSL